MFHFAIAMVARQLKNTRERAMDETLYAVYLPKFLKITNSSLKLFIWINKDIMYVGPERHR